MTPNTRNALDVTPKLVYIAAPYRGATAWDVEQNIREAEALGVRVAQLGAYPVIPHSNTRGYFEAFQGGAFWLNSTMELMRRCDGVVFSTRWGESSGALAERSEAERLKLPTFGVAQLENGAFARWAKLERGK